MKLKHQFWKWNHSNTIWSKSVYSITVWYIPVNIREGNTGRFSSPEKSRKLCVHGGSRQSVTHCSLESGCVCWCVLWHVRCKAHVFGTRAALTSHNATWADIARNTLILCAVGFLITWLLSVQNPSRFLTPAFFCVTPRGLTKHRWRGFCVSHLLRLLRPQRAGSHGFTPLSSHSLLCHWSHGVVAAPGWRPVAWSPRGGDRCLMWLRNLGVLECRCRHWSV